MKELKNEALVIKVDNGLDPGDFCYEEETLCRCDDGNYVLHCRGGAYSRYAEERNGYLSAGDAELRLTEEESLEWAATRMSVDEAFRLFKKNGGKLKW